jgi:hypothetical protein
VHHFLRDLDGFDRLALRVNYVTVSEHLQRFVARFFASLLSFVFDSTFHLQFGAIED